MGHENAVKYNTIH